MSAEQTMQRLIGMMRQSWSAQASIQKPVFWLGAGCSVADGVPLNSNLLDQALKDSVLDWGSPQFRFDVMCDMMPGASGRSRYLRPFFEKDLTPESPYLDFAQLLLEGYADMVFTFNIDDLLEQALARKGLHLRQDYEVVKVPETIADRVTDLVAAPEPRIKIVKLHGDHTYGFNYMTSREIIEYSDEIKALVAHYSTRPAVVCGYSFFHLNVLNAFSHARSPLFYANTAFPDAPMVLSLMASRSPNHPNFVDGDAGTFGTFVRRLRDGVPRRVV